MVRWVGEGAGDTMRAVRIESPLMNADEVRAYLRCSATKWRRLKRELAADAIHIGGRDFWKREDLERWVEQRRGIRSDGAKAERTSVSRTKALAPSTVSERQTNARLRSKLARATPKLSLVEKSS